MVIPTWQRGGMVLGAVESVLAQTRPADEILVVDDGSTDDTAERLAPYADRIRLLRQPNAGQSAAKNRGWRNARGSIVGFLDSDDRWRPQTIEAVEREFRDHPGAGLVSIMAREVDVAGHLSERIYGKRSPGADYATAGLLREDSGGCSWFFVRRELLERAGGFDESLRSAEECDLAVRLSLVAKLRALRRPLLLKGMHEDNISHDFRHNARSWIALLEKLRREHPEIERDHPAALRSALAKAWLRLGRELLVHEAGDPAGLVESRRALRTSLRTWPGFGRAYGYLLWSHLAPRTYARFRRRELRRRAHREGKRGLRAG